MGHGFETKTFRWSLDSACSDFEFLSVGMGSHSVIVRYGRHFYCGAGIEYTTVKTPGTSQAITTIAPTLGPGPRPSTSIVLNEIRTIIILLHLLTFRLCMIPAARVYKQRNIVSIVHLVQYDMRFSAE